MPVLRAGKNEIALMGRVKGKDAVKESQETQKSQQ